MVASKIVYDDGDDDHDYLLRLSHHSDRVCLYEPLSVSDSNFDIIFEFVDVF